MSSKKDKITVALESVDKIEHLRNRIRNAVKDARQHSNGREDLNQLLDHIDNELNQGYSDFREELQEVSSILGRKP